MTAARSRKRRGAETQNAVADYLADHGWPFAESAGSGRRGVDVTGTPGLAWEIKARRELRIPEWLTQAAQGRDGVPLLVHRPDGMGTTRVADWPATLRLADLVTLLHAAGYGTPEEVTTP